MLTVNGVPLITYSRNGWGASAVDALSTAIIMELPDIVKTIVDYIPTINYTYTDQPVSLFETTIRRGKTATQSAAAIGGGNNP